MTRPARGSGLYTEASPLRALDSPALIKPLEQHKGLVTIGDLLEYVPRRYLPPTELTDFGNLAEGEDVFLVAQISRKVERPMKSRRGVVVTVVITDGSHELDLVFFNRKATFTLATGQVGTFAGVVTHRDRAGRLLSRWTLTHPDFEIWDEHARAAEELAFHRDHLIPVYSGTGAVTSSRIRRLVRLALDTLGECADPLPAAVRERRRLVERRAAYELVHRPRVDQQPERGLRRLRFDEAFVLQTILAQRRKATEALVTSPRRPRPDGLLAAFDARLPFELTAGQRAVGEVIAAELAAERPMHRLLQGEVGSGKTVVALRAMLTAIDAGGQAALLAPTEVLAAQHHRSILGLLGDLGEGGLLGGSPIGTRVALLTGNQSAPARRAALEDAATGVAGIVIGTHALIQRDVAFHDLALVVIDEQHRFGVEQRDALREKAAMPAHLLVMTATPIPRTVAMTVFGDMETSALTELPAGRRPISTHVVDASRQSWVSRAWERIAEEVAAGHQAFVVCPRIGDPGEGGQLCSDTSDEDVVAQWADAGEGPGDRPGETDPAEQPPGETDPIEQPPASVYAVAQQLRTEPALAGLRMAILHGRLDPETKDAAMTAFTRGEVDVLVATTVIEVGVDVPRATVMVVMDADRFGLSQLHQLRGRVGRGPAPGLCLLMTGSPAPGARERLEAVAATTDGFELARRDLQLRREGDVLGGRQSGRGSSVKFLRMGHRDDEDLIARAREDAFALVEADPALQRHPALAARVSARLDEEQAAYLERG